MSISKVQPAEHEGSFREASPMDFLFKIQSFSVLSKISVEKYESYEFEAGEYKWKLLLYPNGNKNENGDGHISLYLMLSDTGSLSPGWEVNVFFKLFLFDRIRDRYLIREETAGRTTRFHEMKAVQGFPQFVSLAEFHDLSMGYLVDDTCVFGAEVFVFEPATHIECLSLMEETSTVRHTWRIGKFSNIKEEYLQSLMFKAGGYDWKIDVYPNGYSTAKNRSVSVYLCFVKGKSHKAYVNYKMRMKNQLDGKHVDYKNDNRWFSASSKCWGWCDFIGIGEINDKSKGFLVNDTCILEAEVTVLGVSYA